MDAALQGATVLAHRARLTERGQHVEVTDGVSVHRADRRGHARDRRAALGGVGQRLVDVAHSGLTLDAGEESRRPLGNHAHTLVARPGDHPGDPRRDGVRQVLA